MTSVVGYGQLHQEAEGVYQKVLVGDTALNDADRNPVIYDVAIGRIDPHTLRIYATWNEDETMEYRKNQLIDKPVTPVEEYGAVISGLLEIEDGDFTVDRTYGNESESGEIPIPETEGEVVRHFRYARWLAESDYDVDAASIGVDMPEHWPTEDYFQEQAR